MHRPIAAPLAFLIATACSSDPAGPDGGGDDGSHQVAFSLNSIVVKKTCDEFPVDADGGEWSHKVEIRFPGENRLTLGGTASYPSASSKKNVGEGGTLALDAAAAAQSREIEDEEGTSIELRISATEWDYDLFGNNPSADSRMNNRSAVRNFEFKKGKWPDEPTGVLTLENTGACRVDVNYSIEAVKL